VVHPSVKRVSVVDAHVARANQDEDVDHGAVLISGAHDGTVVLDVTLDGVRIQDTRSSASRQVVSWPPAAWCGRAPAPGDHHGRVTGLP
jgi:hypothetical protein